MIHKLDILLLIAYPKDNYFPWQIIIISIYKPMTRAECMLLPSELRNDLYFLIIKEYLRWNFAKELLRTAEGHRKHF